MAHWIESGRFDGGYFLPGRPHGQAADLVLQPHGALVIADDAHARLSWDAYGSTATGGGWKISHWAIGNGTLIGVAILVTGDAKDRTAEVRARRRTVRNQLEAVSGHGTGRAVPLHPQRVVSGQTAGDIAVLHALCATLRDRPEIRGRLAERPRVEALAAAIADRPAPHVWAHGGRRRPFEVVSAMDRLGYLHPLGGRPVDRAATSPEAETDVVAAVTAALHANPYLADLPIAPDQVRELVEEWSTRVTPWPLAALLEP